MADKKAASSGTIYCVTLHSEDGVEVVEVRADSGDDAAARAHKPGSTVRGVTPKA